MSSAWLAIAVAAAALGLTYLCCVRPMRRGQCATSRPRDRARHHLDDALDQARADLAELKARPTNNDRRTSSPVSDRPHA